MLSIINSRRFLTVPRSKIHFSSPNNSLHLTSRYYAQEKAAPARPGKKPKERPPKKVKPPRDQRVMSKEAYFQFKEALDISEKELHNPLDVPPGWRVYDGYIPETLEKKPLEQKSEEDEEAKETGEEGGEDLEAETAETAKTPEGGEKSKGKKKKDALRLKYEAAEREAENDVFEKIRLLEQTEVGAVPLEEAIEVFPKDKQFMQDLQSLPVRDFKHPIASDTWQAIWLLYKEDPKVWTIRRLAVAFGTDKEEIAGGLYERYIRQKTAEKNRLMREYGFKSLEERNTDLSKEQCKQFVIKHMKAFEEARKRYDPEDLLEEGQVVEPPADEPPTPPAAATTESTQATTESTATSTTPTTESKPVEGTYTMTKYLEDYRGVFASTYVDRVTFARNVIPSMKEPEPRSQARPGRATYSYEEDEVDDGEFDRLINIGFRRLSPNVRGVPPIPPPELMYMKDAHIITPPIYSGSALVKRKRRFPKGGGIMVLVDRTRGLTDWERGVSIREMDGSIRTASWEERRTILNVKKKVRNVITLLEDHLYNFKRDPYKLIRGFPRNPNFDRRLTFAEGAEKKQVFQ